MRALLIEHEPFAPAGMIGERAVARGFRLDIADPVDGRLPDPAGYDAVIVMGATSSVTERETKPWIDAEITALQRAVAADVPVLGICFGGQALAAALDGEVRATGTIEIGWVEVDSDQPDLVPSGPWVAWHEDVFTVPPRAQEIARNGFGPQAFTYGRHLGVQFHPEIDLAIMDDWMTRGPEYLVAGGLDREALWAETLRHEARAREDAYALFDAFWDRASQ